MVSGLSSFLCGVLSDRIGTRVVVLMGGLMFGSGGGGVFWYRVCWCHAALRRRDAGVFLGWAMGASYGMIVFFTRIGMGLDPWLGGWAFDRTAAYTFLYLLSMLFASAGAILALWLRPPVPPRWTSYVRTG